MLVGHVAIGLAGKRAAPHVPLGILVFAALLADLLWSGFLAAGIERVAAVPGAVLNRFAGLDIAWTHSLAMDALWGAILAGVWLRLRRDRRAAWTVFAAVLSHWVLDVAAHRPDMPLAPGLTWKLGLGAWNSMASAILVEGGLWLAAIVLYARSFRFRGRGAATCFWAGIVLLTLIWQNNIRAGIDPNPVRAGIGGLIFFSLVAAWAGMVGRGAASIVTRTE